MSLKHLPVFLLVALCNVAYADQWQEAKSFSKEFANGKVKVQVDTRIAEKAQASITVVRNMPNKESAKLCSGKLANLKRPVDVLASADGRTIVTVDDWEHAGYDHALVFYRCEKEIRPLKDYSLEDFLRPSEISKDVVSSFSSRNWTQNATITVTGDELQIHLKSGRTVHFSLKDGTLKDKKTAGLKVPFDESDCHA
jgi:hypothetical protein